MYIKHFVKTGEYLDEEGQYDSDEGHFVSIYVDWEQECNLLAKYISAEYFDNRCVQEIENALKDLNDKALDYLADYYGKDLENFFEDNHYGEDIDEYPEED